MSAATFKPGDIVRVIDPSRFHVEFGKKIADRDAVVRWLGPTEHGMFKGRMNVLFLKRNGRGKEFIETMWISDFMMKATP